MPEIRGESPDSIKQIGKNMRYNKCMQESISKSQTGMAKNRKPKLQLDNRRPENVVWSDES